MNYVELLMFSDGGYNLWVDHATKAPPVFPLNEVMLEDIETFTASIMKSKYGIDTSKLTLTRFHLRMVRDTSAMPLAKDLYPNDMIHSVKVFLPSLTAVGGGSLLNVDVSNFSIAEPHVALHLLWLVPLAFDRRIDHSYTRWP